MHTPTRCQGKPLSISTDKIVVAYPKRLGYLLSMKTTLNGTEYINGIFTPLDQVQVCAALRKLWQMFADRNTSEEVTMQALELYRSAIDRCGVDQFCAMVRASDELAAMKQLMVSYPDIYTNIKALRP